MLLTSEEPVVRQFLSGRRVGYDRRRGRRDESTMAEQAMVDAGHHDGGVEIVGVPRS